MDKTIEKKFFEAFKWGGVVDNCIEWMRYTYNLPPMKPTNNNQQENQLQGEGKAVKEKWELFYKETLPKKILEETEAFDNSVIMYGDSPLMDEIEANLNECQTDEQRERYLFSLLKPFGDIPTGCGIARIYTPTAEIKRLKECIEKHEKDKAYWETMPENEQLRDMSGKPSGTPKEQIDACNSMIEEAKEQIDWVLHVNHQFCNLTGRFEDGAKWMKEGTVESCLHAFIKVKIMFANRLDALLLTYGIDLMRVQRESGLYLKDHRLITDVDCYVGSRELTQKYIDALPKEPVAVLKQDIVRPHSKRPKQQQKSWSARGKGRPKETLKDKMINDADGSKLQKVHTVMDGKIGKAAALIVLACIRKGWMQKPTFTQVAEEFGDIGTQQGFTKYMYEEKFTQEEIEGAINSLD